MARVGAANTDPSREIADTGGRAAPLAQVRVGLADFDLLAERGYLTDRSTLNSIRLGAPQTAIAPAS